MVGAIVFETVTGRLRTFKSRAPHSKCTSQPFDVDLQRIAALDAQGIERGDPRRLCRKATIIAGNWRYCRAGFRPANFQLGPEDIFKGSEHAFAPKDRPVSVGGLEQIDPTNWRSALKLYRGAKIVVWNVGCRKATSDFILIYQDVTGMMADREGFEPSIPLRVYTRSRRAPSTARPPVRYYSLTGWERSAFPGSKSGVRRTAALARARALKAGDYSGAATCCKIEAMLKRRGVPCESGGGASLSVGGPGDSNVAALVGRISAGVRLEP
jgi:hypothetical protein